LGIRRIGLGRILGLGPGRGRRFDTLADGNSLPPFGDDTGKARHAQTMEHGSRHLDL